MTADDDRFVRLLDAGTELHRIHGLRPGSAAFFDSSPHGRFNLTDVPGRGKCYLGSVRTSRRLAESSPVPPATSPDDGTAS